MLSYLCRFTKPLAGCEELPADTRQGYKWHAQIVGDDFFHKQLVIFSIKTCESLTSIFEPEANSTHSFYQNPCVVPTYLCHVSYLSIYPSIYPSICIHEETNHIPTVELNLPFDIVRCRVNKIFRLTADPVFWHLHLLLVFRCLLWQTSFNFHPLTNRF